MLRCVLLLAVTTLGACAIEVGYDGTRYKCDLSATCPSGFACSSGVCEPVVDGGVDGGAAGWNPTASCGSLALLRDDFADGVGDWGAPFPTADAVVVTEGRLRATVDPDGADARVGYRSRQIYALDGDAVELELGSLAGPGWAGLVLTRADRSVELTVTETTVRCDRRIAGSVERLTAPRDGASLLRLGVHDGRIWCAVASPPPASAPADTGPSWRAVGDHPGLDGPYAQVGLVVGGSAGEPATAAAFAGLNARRTAPDTGWCRPGTLGDRFEGTLAHWRVEPTGDCTLALADGRAVVTETGASFRCQATHQHPLDFSAGTIGFELGASEGSGTSSVGLAALDGSGQLTVEVGREKLKVQACQGSACSELAAVDRDVTRPWVGFVASGGKVRVATSADAQTWTTVHTVEAMPFEPTATVVRFGAAGASPESTAGTYRLETFATQP